MRTFVLDDRENDWLAQELKNEGFYDCSSHSGEHMLDTQEDISFTNNSKKFNSKYSNMDKQNYSNQSRKNKKGAIGIVIFCYIVFTILSEFLIPLFSDL